MSFTHNTKSLTVFGAAKLPFRLSIITVAMLTALNVQADNTKTREKTDKAEMTSELEAIEIIGQAPSKLEKIPGSGFVLDKTTLDRQGVLSSKDALRTVPGVHIVDEDVLGRRFNLGIRGLDPRRSARTQLLEDGAPIQLAPYGDPSNHYIPSMKRVDHVEVLKGSGQIMYGPQTVGGAINFVSAAIPEKFGGSISAAGGNNGYYDTHLRLAGAVNDYLRLSLDYIRQEAGGNRGGQHQEVDDLAVKAQIKIDDKQRLMLKGTLTHEDAKMGEAGLNSQMYRDSPRSNYLLNDQFQVRRYSGQALYEYDIADDIHFSTNIYGNYMFRESIRQANDSSALNNCARRGESDFSKAPTCGNEQRPRTYRVFGIEPKLVFNHDWFGVKSEATVGIRGHFEWADRERYVGNASPTDTTQGTGRNNHGRDRYQDNSLNTQALSFFAQNRLFLGDFVLTPGVRVEHYTQKNINHRENASETSEHTEALPGVGVTYNGFENMTLFAGVHRGFAPARIDDVLNPTTKVLSQVSPELSINYEAGIRAKPLPGISTELTYFRIDYDNQIVNETLIDDDMWVNAGKSVHQGMEFGLRLDSDKLFNTDYNYYLTTSYTYTPDAYFDSNVPTAEIVKGSRLPYAPEHLINANVGVETPWGLDVRFGVQSVSSQFADKENTLLEDTTGREGLIPGYTVYNVSANYEVIKNLKVFMNGYNLSNKKYIASRIDGIQPGQGFQMMGGVKLAF